MTQIVVLGDLNLDIHARLPGTLAPGDEARNAITVRPGGSAGTFARTAATLGASVTFIGAVGDDLVGNLLESSLTQADVTPKLRRTHLPSGAVLAVQMEDDRSMICARGANDGLTPDWVSEAFPHDNDHLHVSGYALLSDAQRGAALRAFELAASLRMTQSLDPPPASLIQSFGALRYLDLLPDGLWLFPNRSEGELLSGMIDEGDVIDVLSKRFPVGAYTLGADGARAWDATTRHLQASQPLPPVDTTGAGDVYAATFVTRFLQSNDLAQANIEACSAAACMLRKRLSPIA
ncbi:carbohydrate kinase family protein [Candidatus Bipolaricaulota bacterium]|nr:carbohydrate kinase family protein [Candidatus Bipolaricaulota bacterium]